MPRVKWVDEEAAKSFQNQQIAQNLKAHFPEDDDDIEITEDSSGRENLLMKGDAGVDVDCDVSPTQEPEGAQSSGSNIPPPYPIGDVREDAARLEKAVQKK